MGLNYSQVLQVPALYLRWKYSNAKNEFRVISTSTNVCSHARKKRTQFLTELKLHIERAYTHSEVKNTGEMIEAEKNP